MLCNGSEHEIRVVARRLSAEAAKEGVKCRRPSATKLRETCVLLTHFQIGEEAKIEVYSNAYAIYDNGDRKGVLWIPGCGRVVYQFTRLRENEKLYIMTPSERFCENAQHSVWRNAGCYLQYGCLF